MVKPDTAVSEFSWGTFPLNSNNKAKTEILVDFFRDLNEANDRVVQLPTGRLSNSSTSTSKSRFSFKTFLWKSTMNRRMFLRCFDQKIRP